MWRLYGSPGMPSRHEDPMKIQHSGKLSEWAVGACGSAPTFGILAEQLCTAVAQQFSPKGATDLASTPTCCTKCFDTLPVNYRADSRGMLRYNTESIVHL